MKSSEILHEIFSLWAQIKSISWIRWKVPRFYRWSCMHNKLLNEWWFDCSKKNPSKYRFRRAYMAVSDESLFNWIQIHLTSKFELCILTSNRTFFNIYKGRCILKKASTINLYNTLCISLGQSSNVPFPSFPTNHLQLLDSMYMPNHFAAFSRMIRL